MYGHSLIFSSLDLLYMLKGAQYGSTTLSTARVVQVSRNGKMLTSGDSYIPGELLNISLSNAAANPGEQFVMNIYVCVYICK